MNKRRQGEWDNQPETFRYLYQKQAAACDYWSRIYHWTFDTQPNDKENNNRTLMWVTKLQF